MVWPAKLIYSVIASLDGYIEDAAGTFGWAAPDEAVHAFVNGLERPVGTYLYGRRMYETMVFRERLPNLADGRRGRIVRQLSGAAEVEVGDAVPVVDAHGRVACRIPQFQTTSRCTRALSAKPSRSADRAPCT
jgi:hypothetical protein